MGQIINIHVKKPPEGIYLATSDDVPGLIAQGRTVTETMEIARDVARKILEARRRDGKIRPCPLSEIRLIVSWWSVHGWEDYPGSGVEKQPNGSRPLVSPLTARPPEVMKAGTIQ